MRGDRELIRIRGLVLQVGSIVICMLLFLSTFNFSSTAVPNMLSVENTTIITNSSNTDQFLQKTRSWTNGEFTNFNTTDGLPNNRIYSLELDIARSTLYIGTAGGLSAFDTMSHTFVNKNMSNGLPSDGIKSLALSLENSELYLGTLPYLRWGSIVGGGLSIYNIESDTFVNRDISNGLSSNIVTALAGNFTNSEVYIGTIGSVGVGIGGLSIYYTDNDTFVNKNMNDGLPSNSINTLALDSANHKLYIGTDYGLSIYDTQYDTFDNRYTTHGLPSNEILSLVVDSLNDKLYIGTRAGLSIYHNGIFMNKDVNDGLPSDIIRVLTLDLPNDLLYIGTSGGGLSIYSISADSFVNKNASDGLPENIIYALELDPIKNKLYIGTENRGLSVYNLYYSLPPINYTQMVLDFIQEHYPNQTVELSNTWEYVTYETNVSYTIVEAMVYYNGIESVDVVTASINHATKHIEVGMEQIQRDYQEYVDSLPIYYQKMESGFRIDIRNDVSFLPTINESKNFSLRYDAVFIINATDLGKMYDAMDIVGAGQEYEYIEEVNWLYGTKSVRINLTLYQTLFIGNHSFVIYLYRESTKYTQMCLDFIQKHYPDETVTLRVKGEHITPETGAKYTIVKSRLLHSKQTIVTSVNHATNHVEFGQGQIYRDYQEYINSLPRPYQKMDRESRSVVKEEFGYFPIIEEVETLSYRCKVTFFVHATNLSKLTDAINATGETYSDIYDLGAFNGIETREVEANLTFHHVLILTNESFVKGVWLWNITPYTIEEKRELVDFLLILIIAVLLIVVAIQSFILFRVRKKK